jgi:hypothetical protein
MWAVALAMPPVWLVTGWALHLHAEHVWGLFPATFTTLLVVVLNERRDQPLPAHRTRTVRLMLAGAILLFLAAAALLHRPGFALFAIVPLAGLVFTLIRPRRED